jgi:pimeloyl-ACP methyl ester carboxylesterase
MRTVSGTRGGIVPFFSPDGWILCDDTGRIPRGLAGLGIDRAMLVGHSFGAGRSSTPMTVELPRANGYAGYDLWH